MKQYEFTDVAKFTFDLTSLEDYIDAERELPVCSFISFYRAIGLTPVLEHYKEQTGKQIVPYDNIVCNFNTLDSIKQFIKRQWQIYSLEISEDNGVHWKNDQYGHEKHYEKNLTKSVEQSLIVDFTNYCPGIDEELEDGEIVFRTYELAEILDIEESEACDHEVS